MNHFRNLTHMLLLACAIMATSCTRTVYQEHEVIRHDSIYLNTVSVDTVMQRDSIHIIERGDTVYKNIYKYIYKVREHTDTCVVMKVDTVTNIVTKIEEKTIRKKDWLSIIGALAIGTFIGFILRFVYHS